MILYLSHLALSPSRAAQIRALSDMLDAVPYVVVPEDSCAQALGLLPQAQVVSDRSLGFHGLSHEPVKLAHLLVDWVKSTSIRVLLTPHTPMWMQVVSLVSAALDVPYVGGMLTRALPEIQRVICAGRFIETLSSPQTPFCATLAEDEVSLSPGKLAISGYLGKSGGDFRIIVPALLAFTSFGEDSMRLDGARVVFAGGRGLGSQESFDKLALCAKKCGAALAGSRLAVDLGWCRNDIQVGQTGVSVSPEVYVAFGISGAIQHVAGIRNARKIIAINSDRDAPIFNFADLGIVADVHEVMDALLG